MFGDKGRPLKKKIAEFKKIKISDEQRKEWVEAGKCHICGNGLEHNHPGWMYLANPNKWSTDTRKLTKEDIQQVFEREGKIATECGLKPMTLESITKLGERLC